MIYEHQCTYKAQLAQCAFSVVVRWGITQRAIRTVKKKDIEKTRWEEMVFFQLCLQSGQSRSRGQSCGKTKIPTTAINSYLAVQFLQCFLFLYYSTFYGVLDIMLHSGIMVCNVAKIFVGLLVVVIKLYISYYT